jgi:hypothetical protein
LIQGLRFIILDSSLSRTQKRHPFFPECFYLPFKECILNFYGFIFLRVRWIF